MIDYGFVRCGVAWLVVFGLSGCGGETSSAPALTSEMTESVVAQSSNVTPSAADGETTYNRFCFSCHAAGIAGAPKVGDLDAWAPRIAKGTDLLLQTSIEGIPPGMPPRGLCMACTDDELRSAIDHMIANSQ